MKTIVLYIYEKQHKIIYRQDKDYEQFIKTIRFLPPTEQQKRILQYLKEKQIKRKVNIDKLLK